ncbi:hypothetical protein J1N35_037373 [Gossypium stocksii]|uniref:Uncharacterized protein n=1 Tax=Gossypium stocksii TaxID=47602 RepID=A0A9D3ULV9_9ROSI|nr:hypothetical protein J1N35_037373 [Gossypium stocksii]
MDISLILKGAYGKEKTNAAPPSKIITRKTNKRIKLDESTQEYENSECPPLVKHKSNTEPVTATTHSSLVPSLPDIPLTPEEFAPQIGSPIHIFDPSLSGNPTKTIPLTQSIVPRP